jgi:rubrerythrin
MPEFGTPFAGDDLGRKYDRDELIRAVRFSIAAEYEAVQFYEQVMNATDDKEVLAIFRDITEEEVMHAGQFISLLERISPEDKKKYEEGFKENTELWEKAGVGRKMILPGQR